MSELGLRVATWNVHGLRGGNAVEQTLREIEPDLVLLQEADGRATMRRLASHLGMRALVDPWSFPRRRVKNAMLIRAGLEVGGLRLHRFPASDRLYPRGALVAQLRAGSLWLASSHLGLRPRERLEHSSELLSVLEKLEPHRVLVGADLNALPGRDAHSALVAGGLVDLWERAGEGSGATFPSKTPRARIDVLLARGSFAVGRIDVVSSSASDHLPVVADLVWGDL